jgi:hypothetical protein
VFFSRDTLRTQVEAASGGRVTVLYDELGIPAYMCVIPKMRYEDLDLDAELGVGVMTAFIKDGQELSEIFIGQYEAHVITGRAVSLPGFDPARVSFDSARAACVARGPGWHMMTAHEWAALAYLAAATSQPRGNTDLGRNLTMNHEVGRRVDGAAPGTGGDGRTYTGSGPLSWRFQGDPFGPADLVGNVPAWVDGLKLVDGEIFAPADNDFGLDEAEWPDTDKYFDSPVAGDGAPGTNLGAPVLTDAIVNHAGTPGSNANEDYCTAAAWNLMGMAGGYVTSQALRRLLIEPAPFVSLPAGGLNVRNYGERMPQRGGKWSSTLEPVAGMAALNLLYARTQLAGFRVAYIP